ncbi:MAG TPA: hypothetical protein ENN65_09205 [Candidatus Hydrogenedentes bacterium]|nr:hypothetical protein [Candidatus Hydrogenedentota bacterium]
MRQSVILLLVGLAVLVGCEAKPPEPPPVEAPPEPTPQEIFNNDLQPILTVLWGPLRGGQFYDDAQHDEAIAKLGTLKARHSATENGRIALGNFTREVETLIREARNANRWRLVKVGCRAYAVMQPGNDRYQKLEERADLMLARPRVAIRGFFETNGELYVFLDVTDPKTGETTNYKIREGEEFHSVLRLVRIVGRNQAAEILYIPVNDTWEVLAPGESR